MQGLAAINVDPVSGTVYAPSTFNADGITMSGFTGDYSALPGDPLILLISMQGYMYLPEEVH